MARWSPSAPLPRCHPVSDHRWHRHTPTNSSPAYAAPITIRSNTVIKVLGVEKGYNNSAVRGKLLAGLGGHAVNKSALRHFYPGVAIITNGTTVTLSCSTLKIIRFITPWTTHPHHQFNRYTGPFKINGQTTVSAMAVAIGYLNSSVPSMFYQLIQAATPVLNPPAGPLTNFSPVALSCATPGAVIHYTLMRTIQAHHQFTGLQRFFGH